jgi:hypothetical protein
MKKLIALTILAVSTAGFACDPYRVSQDASRLQQEAREFKQAVNQAAGYYQLRQQARDLQHAAEHLAYSAQNSSCYQIEHRFRRIDRTFDQLRYQYKYLQNQYHNEYVRRKYRDMKDAFNYLRTSVYSN